MSLEMEFSTTSKPIPASGISPESPQKYVEEISQLPKEKGWRGLQELFLYKNFWLYPVFLEGALHARDHFQAQPTDIFLCSSMKTGTTWLKALSFAIATRGHLPSDDGSDMTTVSLRTAVPHDCIPFLEFNEYSTAVTGSEIPLFASHLPYTCLPKSIIDSDCKIAYICRDPKDTFVSMWFFLRKFVAGKNSTDVESFSSIDEAFELFCKGLSSHGPYWKHILGYWEASKRRPEKILFLKYEDLVEDTQLWVKKLAEFFGCPFSAEEEREGVVERVVKECSFESLRNLEVNRSGKHEKRGRAIENSAYFRKGVVGDWRNHLTDEMGKKIDVIMEEKLMGSGFTF
ncbi:hypothetical protein GOBAR_AA28420 [Gossypium barbadense]|uniref:Sulfotransferase n=3 Tax=Gossypium TaxID=3633 RepID=A0A2P5WMD8_GOSBA|nr:hypothetical protein GOBAR_AA28420 [Gossypium barbadense]TYH04211.1 hypothetical protein ES288_A09G280700v1 [Gossypium darwinii]